MSVKSKSGFSAISLIAYDYEYLLKSIPSYLDYVDELVLGLDIDRKTWAGNDFIIPDQFSDQLKVLDKDSKIKIVEEKFFLPGSSTKKLETRERNLLSERCIKGNWLVSIDSDEVLLNPFEFFKSLANSPEGACVFGSWVMVYKQLDSGALVVSSKTDGSLEIFPIATKSHSAFISGLGRFTEQRRELGPALVLHYSWGRSEAELKQKLFNWAHNEDFDVNSFLNLWSAVDQNTYHCLKDLNPIIPTDWPELIYVEGASLDKLAKRDLVPKRSDELASFKRFIKAYALKHFGISLKRV